jgi:hypothetical protein
VQAWDTHLDQIAAITPGAENRIIVADGLGGWSVAAFSSLDTDTTDHTALSNIGTNTHVQIDTHISNASIHFTNPGFVENGSTDTLTNKTIDTANNNITIVEADISDLAHTVNTDAQTLSFSSPNLSIGNGNSVDISAIDTDTNANTICSGTTTYLDGEGNCDDISSVYQAINTQYTFKTVSTTSGSAPVADSNADTLTLTAGTGISITGSSGTDTVTIANTAGSEWTDTGTILHPNESAADEIVIGGTTEAGADIFLGVDGTAVFNEQSNSVDFRIESNTEQYMVLVDGSADKVGIGGVTTPYARLHVSDITGSFPAISVDTELVVGDGGNSQGLSIIAGSTESSYIGFGDTSSELVGRIVYDHDANVLDIYSNTNRIQQMSASKINFNVDGDNVDTQIEGDTDQFLLYVDASTDNVGIGDFTPSAKLDIAGDLQVQESIILDAEVDDGTCSTSDTIDWGTGNHHKSTLSGSCTYTFTAPGGPTTVTLKIVQSAGSDTVTFPATVKWNSGGTAPTLSTAASAIDFISCYYDGTNYFCMAGLDFQ